ncbi:uncharacterized protein DC041_0012424, partial [Schistosoma bovis]
RLSKNGIKPDQSKQYNGKVRLLEEVSVCLNLTHNFTDCPPIGNCLEKFLFPPFEQLRKLNGV